MRWLVIFVLLPISIIAQTWPKFYGVPGRLDYCKDAIETYDNGFIMLGGYNNQWTWIIKTDINGNLFGTK